MHGGSTQSEHLSRRAVVVLARRIGKKRVTITVAHSILVIAWHLLNNDCENVDLDGDYLSREIPIGCANTRSANSKVSVTASSSSPQRNSRDFVPRRGIARTPELMRAIHLSATL